MENPDRDHTINRKHLVAWSLYDLANSIYPTVIIASVFSVYFAGTIVGNEVGLGDLWWGRVISCSVLFVALSSPLLGSVADQARVRKKMLFSYTYLCIFSVTLFITIDPGMVLWGGTLAVLANIGFEGALVFYNSYLPSLAPPRRQGFASSVGFAAGYAGSIAGLLIVLPLVARGYFDLTWIAVAVFFAIVSLPTFLYLPSDVAGRFTVFQATIKGLKGFKGILKDVLVEKELRRFLLAFFFYIDGVLTIIYFAAIFADRTLGFDQKELIYLFLVVQISALIGAVVMSKFTDIWGPKKVINLTLILWILVVLAVYFVELKLTFFVLAVLAGSGLGVVQAASRTLMSILIPAGKEGKMFGIYALCGKSSSVVGPLVFGQISFLMGGDQRTAVLSVAAFLLIGLVLLQRVRVSESSYTRDCTS